MHIYTNMGLTPGERSIIESSIPFIHIYINTYKCGTHILYTNMGLIYTYIYKYGTHSRRKVYDRVVNPLSRFQEVCVVILIGTTTRKIHLNYTKYIKIKIKIKIKIDITQITLNEETERALGSILNKSSKPCQVAPYPQQRRRRARATMSTHNLDTQP